MKTTPRHFVLFAALACLGLPLLSGAETAPAETNRDTPAIAPATTTASSTTATAEPAAPAVSAPAESQQSSESPAAAATAEPQQSATAPSDAAAVPPASSSDVEQAVKSEDSELRRLDVPSPNDVPAAEEEAAAEEQPARTRSRRMVRVQSGPNDRVNIFGDAFLGKDESAENVVAVVGNATSEGQVRDSVVAVLGNVRATGPVGDSVVAVMGTVYVNSEVKDVVSVLGSIHLGPQAHVRGDVVSVGGPVRRDPGAIVEGEMPVVGLPIAGETVQAYLNECVFKARPLAFAPQLGWAWAIAIGFLLFYVLLALLFRGGMEKTVETLETHPGGSVLAALLTLLLAPVLVVLLLITVVGVAVVPFVGIALALAGLFGRAVMLAWIGRRITNLFGGGAHPAFAVLIGGVIVLGLYVIPVVGFITYKLLGVLGLGVVVYTIVLASKREKRVRPVVPPPMAVPPGAATGAPGFVPAPENEAGFAPGSSSVVTEPPMVAAPPMAALPVAGFWIRTAAGLIDLILVGALLGISSTVLGFHVGPGILLAMAIYAAVLWKLRGSTIGGIICGLRVVRMDNRPLDWATVIVRALGCFVSLLVVGLGFIWSAIDDEKQSWHDKIAGTNVVYGRATIV